MVPFLYPDLKWDFRLKNVVSINASGHKCALLHTTCVHRSQNSDLPPVISQHCEQRTGVCTAILFTKGRSTPNKRDAILHHTAEPGLVSCNKIAVQVWARVSWCGLGDLPL